MIPEERVAKASKAHELSLRGLMLAICGFALSTVARTFRAELGTGLTVALCVLAMIVSVVGSVIAIRSLKGGVK